MYDYKLADFLLDVFVAGFSAGYDDAYIMPDHSKSESTFEYLCTAENAKALLRKYKKAVDKDKCHLGGYDVEGVTGTYDWRVKSGIYFYACFGSAEKCAACYDCECGYLQGVADCSSGNGKSEIRHMWE